MSQRQPFPSDHRQAKARRLNGFLPVLAAFLLTLATSGASTQAATAPVLTPATGSTLAGASQTFTWSAVSSAIAYQLHVGTTGCTSSNIYNSGAVWSAKFLAETVTDLPTNGTTVYATLYDKVGTVWTSVCNTYTAGDGSIPAGLTALSGALSTNGGVAYGGNELFTYSATSYCTIGDMVLSVNGYGAGALPADGRLLPISLYTAVFSLLGTNFGGDGTTNFGLPDLRAFAPKGLQYSICVAGIFPPRN